MMQYISRNRVKIGLGILLTLSGLWLQTASGGWIRTIIDRLEYLAYDLRLNLTLPSAADSADTIIVDIDEESLRTEGRWPWSRKKIGELVDALKIQGVSTVGFDVAFTEPERNVAQELIDAALLSGQPDYADYLEELIPSMDRDKAFAHTLKGKNVALGFLFHASGDESVGMLPSPWTVLSEPLDTELTVPTMAIYTGNLPVLQDSAESGGFLNTTPDKDGVLRSSPLVLRQGDAIYPSLAFAMARLHQNSLRFKIETVDTGAGAAVTGLWLDRIFTPTDQYGRVLIPYIGKRGSFQYLSATKILRSSESEIFPQLEGAVVLIGTSALGLSDLVSTPTSPAFPGVEVQATILDALLSGSRFPKTPDWANAANAVTIGIVGLVLSLLCPAFGAFAISILTIVFFSLLAAGNIWLWKSAQLNLSPVMPAMTAIAVVSMNVLYGYFTEARQKKQVRKAFSHYIAPALVDQLVEDPKKLRLTGESREMSFLFSDIAGFTSFTESTGPEILVSVLNEYLDAMCHEAMEHGGTIDKIVGDAVVVIFNAPIDQPDHAARAVNCALAMDLISSNFILKMEERKLKFGITRIGINTGRAIVGNFGGNDRFDYTAHGDPMNTAARMESVNKHLGTKICVSGTTVSQCPDHFFRPVGSLILKGKTEAIEAFEPITEQQTDAPMINQYRKAFKYLTQGDPKCVEMFAILKAGYPDDPLINLHYNRIRDGMLSSIITLAEK